MSAPSTSVTSKRSKPQRPSPPPFQAPPPEEDPADEAVEGLEDLAPRRMARALALGVLYEVDLVSHSVEQCMAWSLWGELVEPETVRFARILTDGVLAQQQGLDEQIAKLAPAWPVHQLSPVDRNLLRLAIFEVTLSSETPPKAAINEAVELARLFGSESSPRFVNGVLGSVMDRAAQEPADDTMKTGG